MPPTTATLPTQEQVDRIARDLAPDVVRIRVFIAEDWSGHPAIYFHVVLSDVAGRDRLSETAKAVRRRLRGEFRLDDLDHNPYFNFRTQSEQAHLREASWE